ncbi:transcriptional repressor [Qipengyuania sp. DY56-A-20]|jgi:Fur family transcriptional regulator, zinc uptake regulator|uniref:Transcriptional repressor n=1 Tax=Qipengyuania benthica TaxID=3067651 RepID=A0ABT9H4M2_9SPHN|nr:transcriptional repressor [Qipengyuania sp. DY56-A-20]MBU1252764.1 transcriptional repressor [Alphaproteobacteria bacterium]MBU1606625.1 transcriptional repressor [Alphaproteobacteria bacterium]MDP4538256.1 transcriptional repressor [Qipengyuania sp. DY56-A-20]
MATQIHQHAEHSGEDLTAAAQRTLTDAGEQWTGMRASVFEELASHERPASAYDIADNLSASRGKRVAPNSVYRILDLFVRTNLANRIESANAYLVNTHPGCRHDCIFLICDDCGKASHLDDRRVTDALRAAGHDAGFAAVRPVVELRGLCESCAA